jgi:hypothetical protein
LVYLRSAGCGDTRHYCDGSPGDHEILVKFHLADRFGPHQNDLVICRVYTGRNIPQPILYCDAYSEEP